MARRTPEQTAAAFWARVTACGGRAGANASYVNNHTPVALLCAAGHACSPRPVHVLQGKGICRRCAGQDPAAAAAAFWTRVAERGARPAPGAVYVNNQTPVPLICAAGHLCSPRPANLQQGQGHCRTCAGLDPAIAAAQFWARVAEHGARGADGAAYVNNYIPVELVCVAGHRCAPRPTNLQRGQGPCRVCVGQDPAVAEAAFWVRVADRGATAASGAVYVNNRTPVPLICAAGHECAPTPAHLQQGGGPCRVCAGQDPVVAEKAFWERVAEHGATGIPGASYVNARTPVALLCAAGHRCAPTPSSLAAGRGPCATCAGRDPAATAEAFWARVAEVGAVPTPGARYVDRRTPVPLVCAAGHRCAPTPSNAARWGICRACAGQDPATAAREFWARVERWGARAADGAVYVNSVTPVPLICAAGHACSPRPGSLQSGQGPCRTCAGHDPAVAARAFWARVADLGATPAPGAVYVNQKTPVPLICAAGHPCSPQPTNALRYGVCVTCWHDPVAAEAAFWQQVRLRGARPAPGAAYVNQKTPVPLICAAGHDCVGLPEYVVGRGGGVCQQCAVVFDRVYLLSHPAAAAIKVGVASGPGRVLEHAARGYRLVTQWTGLAHATAVATERAVLDAWRASGRDRAPGAPRDGYTETTEGAALPDTLALLVQLLGAADGDDDEAGDPGSGG